MERVWLEDRECILHEKGPAYRYDAGTAPVPGREDESRRIWNRNKELAPVGAYWKPGL